MSTSKESNKESDAFGVCVTPNESIASDCVFLKILGCKRHPAPWNANTSDMPLISSTGINTLKSRDVTLTFNFLHFADCLLQTRILVAHDAIIIFYTI